MKLSHNFRISPYKDENNDWWATVVIGLSKQIKTAKFGPKVSLSSLLDDVSKSMMKFFDNNKEYTAPTKICLDYDGPTVKRMKK